MARPRRTMSNPSDIPEADPFVAWYAAWCAGRDGVRAAESAERAAMQHDVGWLVAFLVGWSLAAALAGGLALALWTQS